MRRFTARSVPLLTKSRLLAALGMTIALGSAAVMALMDLPVCAQADTGRPKITGIAYVRLYSADLNRSREFYRAIVGLGGDTSDCLGAGASCFSVNGHQSIGLVQISAGTPDNLLAEVAFATPDVARMQRYLAGHGVKTEPVTQN